MADLDLTPVETLPEAEADRLAAVVSRNRTLGRFVLQSSDAEGVAIDALEAGTTLVVQTRCSQYRIGVVDGPRHLVLVQGGTMFPEATCVRLEGATDGGSALKVGWVVVGLRIEMTLGPLQIRSSRVRSVVIENVSHRI
jgi:hypothetical protein